MAHKAKNLTLSINGERVGGVTSFDLGGILGAKEQMLALRRQEAERVLEALGLSAPSIEQALEGFTLDHVVLLPEAMYRRVAAHTERQLVRSCPLLTDQVLVVDASVTRLAEFGTPAKYLPARR